MKRFASILMLMISINLPFEQAAMSEELITTVKKGDPAPFAGTLFNSEAAAKLAIDIEFSKEKCTIETTHDVDLQKAEDQLQIDTQTAKLTACQEKSEALLKLEEEKIAFLQSQIEKQRKPNETLWFASGVVGGIALTLASAWAVNLAAQQ